MAFKMKGFPAQQTSAFKDNGKVKVFGGRGIVDTSTKKGKEILKQIRSIPTVSSSEPGRVTKLVKKGFKLGGKFLLGGIINPFSSDDPRTTEQISKANKPKIDTKKTY